jgi:hypothetical protein
MPAPLDLSNQRFGRLIVIRLALRRPGGERRWVCRCDCGNLKVVIPDSLRRGTTRSCGCLMLETARQMKHDHHGSNNPKWRGGISGKGRCRVCGGTTWITTVEICTHCRDRRGEANPFWNHFTSTNPQAGRARAVYRFDLGTCERCESAPAIDRQ